MLSALALAGLLESAAFHVPPVAADLAITEYSISRTNVIERNPLGQTSTRRAVIAVAVAGSTTYLDSRLKNKPLKWAFRIGHLALGAVVVRHNIRAMEAARR